MARDSESRSDLRVGGMRLRARFTLLMSVALTIVMAAAGFFLYSTTSKIAASVQERSLVSTVRLTASIAQQDAERERLLTQRDTIGGLIRDIERGIAEDTPESIDSFQEEMRAKWAEKQRKIDALSETPPWKQTGKSLRKHGSDERVRSTSITYGPDQLAGTLYRYEDRRRPEQPPFDLLLPGSATQSEQGLLGLILGTVIVVILVGSGVSVFVANQVAGPLEQIVADVRQISTGDLNHHTRSRGGGEVGLLARAIDRMTKNLKDARETEVELQVREREVEVAGEVSEALLPQTTPRIEGYDLGAVHLQSSELGGDFHDFIELGDDKQRVGLLVCDVSGKGLPGALVGATARSFLRSELLRGTDVEASFQLVNRQVAQDMRRGVYVTALYVLVDPQEGIATVACAGHKIPLIRYTAADKKVRLIQPEGIALGFDKGPVFDRTLKVLQVPLDPGDRLVLVNTGAVTITNPGGRELGEKPLYKQVMALGSQPSDKFLVHLRAALEKFSGDAELPHDVSIVTIGRA